jgi:cytochrome c2
MGGRGTLKSADPVKTVGSYWPYASTVFDYIRRAMPFGHAQSLSDDEAYALTAFILNINEIVEYDQVLNAQNLAAVQMPNRDGFIKDERPDVPGGEEPCMRDCRGPLKVVGKARIIDVTPDEEKADALSTPSALANANRSAQVAHESSRGKKVFAQCIACHSLSKGEHRVGPSLHGIVGRQSASALGFDRYSPAMKRAELVWDEGTLSKYLKSPQKFIPGTSMPFAGIPADDDIRSLIVYLRSAAN